MKITRPTIMEVDLNAFKHNVDEIKKYIKKDITIMPIIKANAYGTYINLRNDIINEFDIVAVATVDEAVDLRNNDFEKDIFILNQPYVTEIDKILKYNITIGLSEETFLEELGKKNKKVKIHIEIDTGMGRTGIIPSETSEFIDKIKKYPNIIIEGIYTHFSSADFDNEYTKEQFDKFEIALNQAKTKLETIKYIHSSASNAIIKYPANCYNLIRPGIILYGYDNLDNKLNLKPTCILKSKIIFLKTVEEGTSISYSRNFIAKRKSKIATIPIGYADGLRRMLSNKGEVIINGKKVPIIGNVCMDSFMVDVTELEEVKLGDDVYIWDNNIIKVEEIAETLNTSTHEIICSISSRVPRVFKK